jgi:branched-chain amino acid transport system substrate-binding protein
MTEQTRLQSEEEEKKEQRKKRMRTLTYVIVGILIVALVSVVAVGASKGLWLKKDAVKIVTALPFDVEEGAGIAWPLRHAMELALEEADHRAGNLTVEFEAWSSADEEGMPVAEKETEYAEQAAADPAVVAFMGSLGSSGCKESIPILNRAGVAQLSSTATYPGLTKSGFGAGEPAIYYPSGERTFFRVVTPDDMQGPAGALWAKDLGMERVYIVEENSLFGYGLASTFRQTAEATGMTIVGTGIVTPNQQTGLEGILDEVATQQADMIYHAGFSGPGIALAEALRAAGLETSLMGTTLAAAEIDERLIGLEGVMSTHSGIPTEELNEATLDFARRFEKRFGYPLGGRAFWAAMAYDAMGIALASIEQAGEADRAAVVEALHEIEYDGIAGRWSFDENGDTNLLLVTGFVLEGDKWQSIGLLRVR